MMPDPRAVARALGGEAVGRDAVLAPGPGHGRADRSLSVKLDPAAPDGFRCYSFAGDDWCACRDHVRALLGIARWEPRPPAAAPRGQQHDAGAPAYGAAHDTAPALGIYREAHHPAGTNVETYLAARGLLLPDDLAGEVIRFHPRLKFLHPDAGARNGALVGGMVALFRDLRTNEPCGISRTFLDRDGRPFLDAAGKKIRKMLGRVKGAAVKLDADEDVTLGLHIGEGFESCFGARLAGFRPVWALGSAGGIASFPVLPAIEAITILGETDDGGANHRAGRACAARWIKAGREALTVEPLAGGDLADVWRELVR